MLNMTAAISFVATLVAMLVAHTVADHMFQTHHQATSKGGKGWAGRLACARHVAIYTTATAGIVVLLGALHLAVFSWWGLAAGQLVSAVTHYWADRITTLSVLAKAMGRGDFYRFGAPRRVAGFVERPEGGLDPVLVCEVDDAGKPVLARNQYGELTSEYVEAPHDNSTLGTGAYALDQAWHSFWLLVAALLTALVGA
jgi:hypothetical protein